jgi:hypothetical protein
VRINFNNIATIITKIAQNAEGQESKQSLSNNSEFAKTFTNLHQYIEQSKAVKIQDLSKYQMNMLIRELMSLPKEWSAFLKLIVMNNNSANLPLEILLLKNPKIDLNNMSQLLNQNSAKMLDKLIKLSMSTGNQQSIEQFREVVNIGNAMFSNVSLPNGDLLRNTLPLYLLWLPLNDPNLNKLEDLKKEFNPIEKKQDSETLFFISTKNIGKLKISIILLDKKYEINIINIIPEKNEELEKQLKQKINSECSKVSVGVNLFYSSKLSENSEPAEKQLYIINTDNSLVSLILLQLVAKAVFETDDRALLIKERKSKIEN